MPLAVRYVEPLKPSSMPLLDAVQSNHLQALIVQNLTGVIRQLASLAKHAEDIMGNIADVLGSFHGRTVVLEERTKRLREEILPRLDADREGEKAKLMEHVLCLQFTDDGLSCTKIMGHLCHVFAGHKYCYISTVKVYLLDELLVDSI